MDLFLRVPLVPSGLSNTAHEYLWFQVDSVASIATMPGYSDFCIVNVIGVTHKVAMTADSLIGRIRTILKDYQTGEGEG